MVQYKRSRWTRMEHEVLREFIERDSKLRPVGRCVKCCKCCYLPECAQMTYLVCGVVLMLGLAFLVAFYLMLIHPTVEGALYADQFTPVTCKAINYTYLEKRESCNCGRYCWRKYPCLRIRVLVTSVPPSSLSSSSSEEVIATSKQTAPQALNTHQAMLFDNTKTLRLTECAFVPAECAQYAYTMEQEIENFRRRFAVEGATYGCLQHPSDHHQVALVREDIWEGLRYLHFIVWPGVVIGFSLLIIVLACSICGCAPYVCFRKIPSDVRDEAHTREAEIALKAKNIETCRTIPDFSAGTLPHKKPHDEIHWKQYDYIETGDSV